MEKGANHDLKANFQAARDLRRELALRNADVPYAKRELLEKYQHALEQTFRSALTAADFDFDITKRLAGR